MSTLFLIRHRGHHDRCCTWSRKCLPSGAPDFTSGFHRGSLRLVICVSLFHVIVLSFGFCVLIVPFLECLVSIFFTYEYWGIFFSFYLLFRFPDWCCKLIYYFNISMNFCLTNSFVIMEKVTFKFQT